MTDEQATAYIAGIIDGEGCIGITRHKNGLGIVVSISMTDPSAIDFIRPRYGGGRLLVQRKGHANSKPVYMWRVEARKAEILLRDIQPLLLVKRRQCDLALEVRDHMHAGGIVSRGPAQGRAPEKDAAILAFREDAKSRMHALNRRGVT